MPDEGQDQVAQLAQQQAEFGKQLQQAMQALAAKVDRVAQVASAPRQPQAPPPRSPSLDEYKRHSQAVLEKFVEDPIDVLNRTAEDGAKRGYELARREYEQKLSQHQAQEYAERLKANFYAQNPDLQRYDGWVGAELVRMPQEWSVEEKLTAAANTIRSELAQRDAFILSDEGRRRAQEIQAQSAGGRPRLGAQDDDVPMDELSMRRKLASMADDYQRQRMRSIA